MLVSYLESAENTTCIKITVKTKIREREAPLVQKIPQMHAFQSSSNTPTWRHKLPRDNATRINQFEVNCSQNRVWKRGKVLVGVWSSIKILGEHAIRNCWVQGRDNKPQVNWATRSRWSTPATAMNKWRQPPSTFHCGHSKGPRDCDDQMWCPSTIMDSLQPCWGKPPAPAGASTKTSSPNILQQGAWDSSGTPCIQTRYVTHQNQHFRLNRAIETSN